MNSTTKDTWSPILIVTSTIASSSLVLIAQVNFWSLLISILLAASILFIMFIWLCRDILRGRLRHAFSIAVAIVSAGGIAYQAPLVARGKDEIAFYSRQADFQKQVEDARARRKMQEPLQMVLDYEDESVFVTANSFYYLIYDETDGAGPYPAAFWPYARSPTGVISVAVPDKMQHLAGHFYSFRVSY